MICSCFGSIGYIAKIPQNNNKRNYATTLHSFQGHSAQFLNNNDTENKPSIPKG